ncbi:hypothetical protein C1646_754613 [Rhizophagus diaphanus]|nr:hypothetical protein C1646_754613 [Rhizophagus diaphanus] [Rhizophagus sp. MUCL 43196]
MGAYWIGICIGNFGLQQDSLSATGPLFASATKSNYTTAIAHLLAILAAHLQLEEQITLFYIDSRDFWGKIYQRNVTGNIIDEKNLKNQINHLRMKEKG